MSESYLANGLEIALHVPDNVFYRNCSDGGLFNIRDITKNVAKVIKASLGISTCKVRGRIGGATEMAN